MGSVWRQEFYPGLREKHVEEFRSDFQRGRELVNLVAGRRRDRWLPPFDRRIQPEPSVDPALLEQPVFPDDIMNHFQPLDISEGKPLDLISLLTITGDSDSDSKSLVRFHHVAGGLVIAESVEDMQTYFNGKHVCLLCFYVPIHIDSVICGRLMEYSLFANEMSANHSDQFVTVLVVKMRPKWANDEAVFTHFVSAFSPSCLVVPFQDTTRIDAICRCLHLQDERQGLLVYPHGVVARADLNFIGVSNFLDSFPLINQDRISSFGDNWHNRPLDRLLGSHRLTRCFSQDGSAYNNKHSISVSELANNKVLGLYLCLTGSKISLIHKVYNECLAQHLDFEVVLVYVHSSAGSFPDVMEDVIGSYINDNKIPFWVLPFNYAVSCRLNSLIYEGPSDKLLIVSYGKLVELYGEKFVLKLGSNAYPFHRESIIQRALGDIQKLTLESLLEGGSLHRGNKSSDEVAVTCLKGKNVILFLGKSVERMELLQLIEKHYDEIKHKHGGFEVVFVCLDDTISPPMEERISSTPWLVFHPDNSRPRSVIQALSLWGVKPYPSLVAFGADGKICSLAAESALKSNGCNAFPFSADLREQIADKLDDM